MTRPRVFPIILSAGGPGSLGFPKPLARFGNKTALEIAIDNCCGLQPPVIVLGYGARRARRILPEGVRSVVNREWRRGQLSSLLAGLSQIPPSATFLVYPVDQPLLTRSLVDRLVRAYASRSRRQKIAMPRAGIRAGHPIVCDASLRRELAAAKTAREVVYCDESRILYVPVRDSAIWLDFNSAASYRRCRRLYLARRR